MNFEVFIHNDVEAFYPPNKFLIIYEDESKQSVKSMYYDNRSMTTPRRRKSEWFLVTNQPYWFEEFCRYPERFTKIKLTENQKVAIFTFFL